jgi:hypothetical protein
VLFSRVRSVFGLVYAFHVDLKNPCDPLMVGRHKHTNWKLCVALNTREYIYCAKPNLVSDLGLASPRLLGFDLWSRDNYLLVGWLAPVFRCCLSIFHTTGDCGGVHSFHLKYVLNRRKLNPFRFFLEFAKFSKNLSYSIILFSLRTQINRTTRTVAAMTRSQLPLLPVWRGIGVSLQ